MNKLDKSYFIKIKTSVIRINSNVVSIVMEVRARQRYVEFKSKN